jgi:hypothetical protein
MTANIRFDSYGIEMQFNGTDWIDVTADVVGKYTLKAGIRQGDIVDRVASSGIINITLDNSAFNSLALEGAYSPGHTNCRSGFDIGLAVRLYFVYDDMPLLVYGRIPKNGINVTAGKLGRRLTKIKVSDWIEEAANSELAGVEVGINKRIDEAVEILTGGMSRPPQSTNYATGDYTFPSVFDSISSRTRVLSELSKLVRSEFGYTSVIPNSLNGETLLVESLSTRPDKTSPFELVHDILTTEDGRPLLTEAGVCLGTEVHTDAVFSDTMMTTKPERGKHIVNRVTVTLAPRVTKSVGVLFTLQQPLFVPAGETVSLSGPYKDPDNAPVSVTGINMIAPVSGTDYIASQYLDGGSDLTSDFDVSADYSNASKVSYTIENTGTINGWVTTLQARGNPIVTYDVVELSSEDETSKTAYGAHDITYDMPYMSNTIEGPDISAAILARYKDPFNAVQSARFCANGSAFLMRAFMQLYTGARVTMDETVSGIDTDFFINGFEFEVNPGGVVYYRYNFAIPMGWDYLGVESRTTTVVADAEEGDYIEIIGAGATMALARTTAVQYDLSLSSFGVGRGYDAEYIVVRFFMRFDTSWLPSRARIKSAVIKMAEKEAVDPMSTDIDISIVQADWSAYHPATAGNYGSIYTTAIAPEGEYDNLWQNTADINWGTIEYYSSSPLEIDYINRDGYTYYAVMTRKDYYNQALTIGDEGSLLINSPDGTSSIVPVLEITWEIP